MPDRDQTKNEEIVNALTHGIGAGLSIAALAVLVAQVFGRGDAWTVASIAIYGASLIALYLASTFYHAFSNPRMKRLFKIFDHSAIYLLIAGTYTPVCLVTLRGAWGWSLFGVVWGIALAGIVFKAFFTGRFKAASTVLYVAMGWIVIIAIKPLLERMPEGAFAWFLAGGVCYTGGVLFYSWKRLPFHHSVWHLFVLGGSALQFFGVIRLLPL